MAYRTLTTYNNVKVKYHAKKTRHLIAAYHIYWVTYRINWSGLTHVSTQWLKVQPSRQILWLGPRNVPDLVTWKTQGPNYNTNQLRCHTNLPKKYIFGIAPDCLSTLYCIYLPLKCFDLRSYCTWVFAFFFYYPPF